MEVAVGTVQSSSQIGNTQKAKAHFYKSDAFPVTQKVKAKGPYTWYSASS